VLFHTLAQLRQEKAWVDQLLEAVVEGIVALDPHNRVAYFSQGAERISGCRREDVLGVACDDIFLTPAGEPTFSQNMPAPGAKEHIEVSFPSGREAALAITGAHLGPPGAGIARRVLVLRDVTEERLIHRLLGDYIGNITHEFRTPLAAQAAAVELLIEQLPDLTPAEIESLLGSLRLGVVELQTLIDNLIEGASIETGRFRVYARPASLADMCTEAVRLVQPLIERRGLRLELRLAPDLPAVQADPRRTVQVLVNLLGNALRHSPPAGVITLEADQPSAGEVRVTVADQGPGIPLPERERLFRRSVRPEAEQRTGGHGAGLGLPVVKAIVTAQGGQVGIEENTPCGARVWFTLRLAGESQPGPEA
jgi:signal transduction histidine kinase